MKNYFKQNPHKLIFPFFIISFVITINLFVNIKFTDLALSLSIGVFSILILFISLLQVWGEYKGIEGFKDTFKQFFKWK